MKKWHIKRSNCWTCGLVCGLNDVSCGRGNYVPYTRIQWRAKGEEIVAE